MPLVRLEGHELNDGADEYSLATLSLGDSFPENARGFLEYRDTCDTPAGVPTDNATTLQVEVVFQASGPACCQGAAFAARGRIPGYVICPELV